MHDIQSGLVGTRTEKNLYDAAIAESQDFTKYKIFSSIANEEGYRAVGDTFDTFANQEKEHAEIWLNYLAEIGNTKTNLEYSSAAEEYGSGAMYPLYAEIAQEEGFDEIANKFLMIGNIEKNHRDTFLNYLARIETDTMFKADRGSVWQCLNCGFEYAGRMAPDRCPVCSYPRGYFARMCLPS